jgi:hypothetical protein
VDLTGSQPHARAKSAVHLAPAIAPLASGVLLALLPKCPACVAVYLSALGGFSADALPFTYVWPATWLFLALGLGLILRTSLSTREFRPLVFAAAGACVIALGRWLDAPGYTSIAGLVLLAIGSGWSVVSRGSDNQRRVCH